MTTALRVEAAVAGRKRAGASEHALDLDLSLDQPTTLRALIESVVRAEVAAFRARADDQRFVRALTERQVAEGAAQGAIRSGGGERATEVDPDEAVAAALLAHQDGLYKVIVDDELIDDLDAPLSLHPASHLLFLRLVALAGG